MIKLSRIQNNKYWNLTKSKMNQLEHKKEQENNKEKDLMRLSRKMNKQTD